MKKIKGILLTLLAFVLFIPVITNASDDNKVKVYIFEAGGCPYCESEIEYLKGLDSYDKKFTIVEKELYVDHVDWEEGKDYELGVKVANSFKDAGFENASYEGTPFVVISNLYAAATYSEDLESIIDEAYEAGDQDVVGCFEEGGTDCLKVSTSSSSSNGGNAGVIVTTIICTFVLLITYLVKSSNDQKKLYAALGISKPNFSDKYYAEEDDIEKIDEESEEKEVIDEESDDDNESEEEPIEEEIIEEVEIVKPVKDKKQKFNKKNKNTK